MYFNATILPEHSIESYHSVSVNVNWLSVKGPMSQSLTGHAETFFSPSSWHRLPGYWNRHVTNAVVICQLFPMLCNKAANDGLIQVWIILMTIGKEKIWQVDLGYTWHFLICMMFHWGGLFLANKHLLKPQVNTSCPLQKIHKCVLSFLEPCGHYLSWIQRSHLSVC